MKSPKFLKKLYASIPWRLRMGKTYRNTYDFLKESESWSRQRWGEYQQKKLREMMEYCYQHIPYYQKTFKKAGVELSNEDIFAEYDRLPFLSKKEVVKYSDQFFPKHIDKEKLYKASTGGTTGKPVTIYFDKYSYKKEWAFKIYAWNNAVGYTPDSKKASFRGVKLGGKLFYENPIYNEIRFSPFKMDDDSLSKISEKILDYNPDFLHGYPSAIERLTKYLSKRNVKLSVKGVMLVSENIYPYQVELFKIFFDAPIYSFYGHTERCILASMDSNLNNYYPHPAYGYTELIDEEGKVISDCNQIGELVGTGFINKGMPLLKYHTGDYSQWIQGSDSAWNIQPLAQIKGRWDQEFLISKEGQEISLTALNMHSDVFSNVKKHQFYQDTLGEIVFRVVKDSGYDKSDEREIKKQLHDKLGEEFNLKVKYVKSIELTQSGKSKYLVQHLN